MSVVKFLFWITITSKQENRCVLELLSKSMTNTYILLLSNQHRNHYSFSISQFSFTFSNPIYRLCVYKSLNSRKNPQQISPLIEIAITLSEHLVTKPPNQHMHSKKHTQNKPSGIFVIQFAFAPVPVYSIYKSHSIILDWNMSKGKGKSKYHMNIFSTGRTNVRLVNMKCQLKSV